jgi:hypothetical protein
VLISLATSTTGTPSQRRTARCAAASMPAAKEAMFGREKAGWMIRR